MICPRCSGLAKMFGRGKANTLPRLRTFSYTAMASLKDSTIWFLSKELPSLRQACEQMYPPADIRKGLPRFTVIICGKRHKTRFYPTNEQTCNRSGITQPGTVVDRGLTETLGTSSCKPMPLSRALHAHATTTLYTTRSSGRSTSKPSRHHSRPSPTWL